MSDTRFPERRRERRRSVVKVARIVIDEQPVASCTVRNMSMHGSKLLLDAMVGAALRLPDQFVLDVFGEPPREAKVIWRGVGEVGVELDEI
jgi:hypothetical protein